MSPAKAASQVVKKTDRIDSEGEGMASGTGATQLVTSRCHVPGKDQFRKDAPTGCYGLF